MMGRGRVLSALSCSVGLKIRRSKCYSLVLVWCYTVLDNFFVSTTIIVFWSSVLYENQEG